MTLKKYGVRLLYEMRRYAVNLLCVARMNGLDLLCELKKKKKKSVVGYCARSEKVRIFIG